MRVLNGFILTGIVLFFISVAGLVYGNPLLTEPGQKVNQYAWLEYLGAAVLMVINGLVSIWVARRHEDQRPSQSAPPSGGSQANADAPTAAEAAQ